MKYCTTCGVELENSAQKVCQNCKGELKSEGSEPFNLVPIDNIMSHESFKGMNQMFVPINTSSLTNNISKYDRILSSLICKGHFGEKKIVGGGPGYITTRHSDYEWDTHVLITTIGIAFRTMQNYNAFVYWKNLSFSHDFDNYRGGEGKIKVEGGILIKFNNLLIESYPEHNIQILNNNFVPFCKLVQKNFKNFLSHIKSFAKNVESLKEKITQVNIDIFIEQLKLYLRVENKPKTVIKIVENSLKIINSDEKKQLLGFLAELYLNMNEREETIKILDKLLEISTVDEKIIILNKKTEILKSLERFNEVLMCFDEIISYNTSDLSILEKKKKCKN